MLALAYVLPLREIHKSGRSFLWYRWLRAMNWFMLTLANVLPLRGFFFQR